MIKHLVVCRVFFEAEAGIENQIELPVEIW